MNAEMLAKMTARGIAITGAGFGGKAEITASDVAASMAGMPDQVYDYMRLRYCGDSTMLKRVTDRVAYKLLGEAMSGEFDLKVSVVCKMAILIVYQVVRGPLCTRCNGTGLIKTLESADDCPSCSGSGKAHMPKGKAAAFIGVGRETYVKKYEKLVARHVADLQTLDSAGFAHMGKKLSEKNACRFSES